MQQPTTGELLAEIGGLKQQLQSIERLTMKLVEHLDVGHRPPVAISTSLEQIKRDMYARKAKQQKAHTKG